jgi:hypothetical protein
MDLQTYFQRMIAMKRAESFVSSPQLTLGQIIEKLEPIVAKQRDKKDEAIVQYDFGTAIPTSFQSWRGAYCELALGYCLTGYDNGSNNRMPVSVSKLLDMCKNAIGETFEGWKGGYFTMNENTPVWVDNPGNASNTGITEIVDDGWRVILMTAYCEY